MKSAQTAQLTCDDRKWSRDLVRCTGVVLMDGIVDSAAVGVPGSKWTDRLTCHAGAERRRLVRSCLEEARLIGVESLPGASIEWSSPFIVRTYPALDRPDARDPTLRRACEAPALHSQCCIRAFKWPF